MQYSLTFPSGTVRYIFQNRFEDLASFADTRNCILLVDSTVADLHSHLFSQYSVVRVQADENHKSLHQLELIVSQLLQLEAHKATTLIAVGGGIITDITGFIASTYMRGLQFGFVPTTLLCMADAAIGGKNGVNVGLQKNLLGTIQQPGFIFYDPNFLCTLPSQEWSNGFAEVIKYACLFDPALFDELFQHDIDHYRNNAEALELLIERCADWKNGIVLNDEKETGKRKLLNFGHTIGHAIETVYNLPHGFAVAIGMCIACSISEHICALDPFLGNKLRDLLSSYGLPCSHILDTDQLMSVLKMDKKRSEDAIDFILLENIGKPIIHRLPFSTIQDALENFSYAGSR